MMNKATWNLKELNVRPELKNQPLKQKMGEIDVRNITFEKELEISVNKKFIRVMGLLGASQRKQTFLLGMNEPKYRKVL